MSKVNSTAEGLILFALASTMLVSSVAVISSAVRVLAGGTAILAVVATLGLQAAKAGLPVEAHRLFMRQELLAAKIVAGLWACAFAICATATFMLFAASADPGHTLLERKVAALKSMERSRDDIEDYEIYVSYGSRINSLRSEIAELRAVPDETLGPGKANLAMGVVGLFVETISAFGLLFLRWMTARSEERILPEPPILIIEPEQAPTVAVAEGPLLITDGAAQPFVSAAEPINPEKDTSWMWNNVAPYGAITLITGQPKVGKSQIAIHMAAVVSVGGAWPDKTQAEKGSVILMETEDFLADTQRRLLAAGADPARIVVRDSEAGPFDLSTPEGMAILKGQADSMTALRLLVLSPALSFFGRVSTSDVDVRRRLAPLLLWAAQNRVAVVMITHPAKNAGKSLNAQFAGADGFRRAARSAYVAMVDPEDTDPNEKRRRRVLVCAGCNGGDDTGRFFYRIKGTEINGRSTSCVNWLTVNPIPEEKDENEIANDEPEEESGGDWTNDPDPEWERVSKKKRLEFFILGVLSSGPKSIGEIKRLAAAQGINAGNSAYYRAASDLKIKMGDRTAFGGSGLWSLPAPQDFSAASNG